MCPHIWYKKAFYSDSMIKNIFSTTSTNSCIIVKTFKFDFSGSYCIKVKYKYLDNICELYIKYINKTDVNQGPI